MGVLVDGIDKAGEEHMGFSKTDKQTNSLNGLETSEDENFRIRIRKQSEFLDELNKKRANHQMGAIFQSTGYLF